MIFITYVEGPLLMPPIGEKKCSYYQESLQSVKVEVLTFGAVLYPHLVKNCSIPDVIQERMCSK